ncbi:MAG: hypothetical protein EZS28_034606, partial [Streblomastix strix]
QNNTINESINEQINEQTNKEKHEKILYDLCNVEVDQETRLENQNEEYRLEKYRKQQDKKEAEAKLRKAKQEKREEFDLKANEIINKQATEEAKKRIANKIACLKMLQEKREIQRVNMNNSV